MVNLSSIFTWSKDGLYIRNEVSGQFSEKEKIEKGGNGEITRDGEWDFYVIYSLVNEIRSTSLNAFCCIVPSPSFYSMQRDWNDSLRTFAARHCDNLNNSSSRD